MGVSSLIYLILVLVDIYLRFDLDTFPLNGVRSSKISEYTKFDIPCQGTEEFTLNRCQVNCF